MQFLLQMAYFSLHFFLSAHAIQLFLYYDLLQLLYLLLLLMYLILELRYFPTILLSDLVYRSDCHPLERLSINMTALRSQLLNLTHQNIISTQREYLSTLLLKIVSLSIVLDRHQFVRNSRVDLSFMDCLLDYNNKVNGCL